MKNMKYKELIDALVKDLIGTSDNFQEVFEKHTGVSDEVIDFFSPEELSYLDEQIFMCQECERWFSSEELNEDWLCPSCYSLMVEKGRM